MKINIKPNSYDFLEYQKKYINDYEIGIIMGLDPYNSKEELIKNKIFKNSLSFNKEKELEKKIKLHANLFFSILKKRNYEPAVFVKENIIASLDGFHSETKTMLEIKCPQNKNIHIWKKICSKNIIPPYYLAQIYCRLYCSDSSKAYFLVYFHEEDFHLTEINFNNIFIQKMIIEINDYQKILKKYRKIFKT
ncbi:putative phage-type endonuclease domain protein [Candidatus Phytoplasma oryzae]|uniref:Putative phage-type endonuclease domain protein n=1 Tax=Candidatus Phytoplasma oryzae TaxID=203274 RepID=A0A139JQY0_9MOLU|nr:YqaJ viral recombinase family protein [Candidatus Phytoplasma oryzae]KXT29260.1 putative phage-type endonuclease domain protein [Candidatus Phytoplasma oryzae]RAM57844.1 hypothetical protein DH96_00760 [Candidatus Phytoplasma oryzae]